MPPTGRSGSSRTEPHPPAQVRHFCRDRPHDPQRQTAQAVRRRHLKFSARCSASPSSPPIRTSPDGPTASTPSRSSPRTRSTRTRRTSSSTKAPTQNRMLDAADVTELLDLTPAPPPPKGGLTPTNVPAARFLALWRGLSLGVSTPRRGEDADVAPRGGMARKPTARSCELGSDHVWSRGNAKGPTIATTMIGARI